MLMKKVKVFHTFILSPKIYLEDLIISLEDLIISLEDLIIYLEDLIKLMKLFRCYQEVGLSCSNRQV